jgi:hypothetical protein
LPNCTEYKDWWKPKDDVIVLPPSVTAAAQSLAPASNSGSKDATSEKLGKDVFLSYQWDKQPQVQYLYKLLTAMGYSCWMDIYEMGGGDSLYDAIDKGIRHSKVVVSHVTSKYALSANCRREISLSDALKKPIIPLLLDDMTWPPEGPMSMVFTQLLYIDFKDSNSSAQQLWSGTRLDQLISKVDGYLGRKQNVAEPASPAKRAEPETITPVKSKTTEKPVTSSAPVSSKPTAHVSPAKSNADPALSTKPDNKEHAPATTSLPPSQPAASAEKLKTEEKPVQASSIHVSSKPVAHVVTSSTTNTNTPVAVAVSQNNGTVAFLKDGNKTTTAPKNSKVQSSRSCVIS